MADELWVQIKVALLFLRNLKPQFHTESNRMSSSGLFSPPEAQKSIRGVQMLPVTPAIMQQQFCIPAGAYFV